MNLNNLELLRGDASFRKFYRNKNNNSIIVHSLKHNKQNLLIYDAINKILINNKIHAPKLKSEKYKLNYIEIEDLGNITVFKKLKNNTKLKFKYYKKIIKLLVRVQKIKNKKIKTFLNTEYYVPTYTKKKILDEVRLFLDWYIPKKIHKKKQNLLKKKLNYIFNKLIYKLKNKKLIFVHRDFHVSNLMIFKNKLVIIDTQDAVYGNIAYDLASLIDDVRLKSSLKLKAYIFKEYLNYYKNISKENFKNDFEILSVLRNLKIIGIFTRLSVRDKKHNYLKLIPYAWKLIESRIDKNKNLIDLKIILNKFFSKKMREHGN